MSYSTFQPNSASTMQSLGMSTNFNDKSALATSNAGEYIPFKTKYDLGKKRFHLALNHWTKLILNSSNRIQILIDKRIQCYE